MNLIINIGHPAYRGENAPAVAYSKNAAVELLRKRGVKRDEARAAIDLAMLEQGYSFVYAGCCPVEIHVIATVDVVQMERQIINRNANLALDVHEDLKREYGHACRRSEVARRILRIKRGLYAAPPRREVRL